MMNNMMMGGMIPLRLANRNTCRINGKTMKQVEEELMQNLPEELLKDTHDGFKYFPCDVLVARLEEVVGPLNYTVVPIPVPAAPMQYTARPEKSSGQEPYETVEFMEKVISAIAIYSDEGELAILKYAYGAGKYETVNATGRLKDTKNLPDSVVSDATKRSLKDLGIGSRQLAVQKKKSVKDKKLAGTEQFSIQLKKNFTLSNGYGRCRVLNRATSAEVELFVGKDCVLSEENKNILFRASAGQNLSVIGRKNSFNGKEQIILVDIVKGEKNNG